MKAKTILSLPILALFTSVAYAEYKGATVYLSPTRSLSGVLEVKKDFRGHYEVQYTYRSEYGVDIKEVELFTDCRNSLTMSVKQGVRVSLLENTLEKYMRRESAIGVPLTLKDRQTIVKRHELGLYAQEYGHSHCVDINVEAILDAESKGGSAAGDKRLAVALDWAHLRKGHVWLDDKWNNDAEMEEKGFVLGTENNRSAWVTKTRKQALEENPSHFRVIDNFWVYVGPSVAEMVLKIKELQRLKELRAVSEGEKTLE